MVINETNTTTKENKATGKVNIEPLAVNIETLQDLTDEAQQGIAGGRALATVDRAVNVPSAACI